MSQEHQTDRAPLPLIKRYLLAHRWRRRILSSGLEVFTPEGLDDVEIVLPGSVDANDLHPRINGALATLAALERRPSEEIIASIRAISYDLVRSRLPDAAIRNDTIKLGTAEEFVHRMTRILAASAHAELHPNPYFLRIDNTAQRYANDCRFGHTFRGSFGFTVESPVGPNTGEIIVEEAPAPPLERRAIRRLARGLRIIESAITADDTAPIVKGYTQGLNANACEDLAALVEMPHVGELKMEILFSPEWGIPSDLSSRLDFSIGQARGVDVMKSAARELRIVNSDKIITISGKIRTLHSLENPSDLFSITGSQDIVIEWSSVDVGRRNVHVSLGPEEYLQAVEAHKLGRNVTVTGELEQGRFWRLQNPRGFRVAE